MTYPQELHPDAPKPDYEEWVRERWQSPGDPRWYVTEEVTAVDAIRCPDTWEFGGSLGKVQCSREDGHGGHHFANGDNPFSIYYRWGTIGRDELVERESLEG